MNIVSIFTALVLFLGFYSVSHANSSDLPPVLENAQENLAKNEKKSSQQVSSADTKKQPAPTRQPVNVIPKADFINSNFNILFATPNSYVGKTVDLSGKILAFPGPGQLQMYVGGNTNYDTVITYNETFVFVQDDCVKVTGIVGEVFEGTNAFLAMRTVPSISAKTIDKLDCTQAIDPAVKTAKVEQTQMKAGIKMVLHKVEFSDKNTRAHLTVENLNGKTGISFYDFDAKAILGNRQYSTTYSYDVDYPAIKSDIPPRIREDGVVLFEPLDYKSQSLVKFQFQATRGVPIKVMISFLP